MGKPTIWEAAAGTFDPVAEAEYVKAAAKLDHMAKHHGFRVQTCPCGKDRYGVPDPACQACGGEGLTHHADSWDRCALPDCPVRSRGA